MGLRLNVRIVQQTSLRLLAFSLWRKSQITLRIPQYFIPLCNSIICLTSRDVLMRSASVAITLELKELAVEAEM